MESDQEKSADNVAVLPHELLLGIISQLNEASEEIWCFAGKYPDEDARRVLNNIESMLTKIEVEAVITPNPWEALATAEMALADWETAKRKGYVVNAKQQVFAVMDAKRANQQA